MSNNTKLYRFLLIHIIKLRFLPHPALSKVEGSEKSAVQVLSFGEDLGEA
jgi:hypothetical protein